MKQPHIEAEPLKKYDAIISKNNIEVTLGKRPQWVNWRYTPPDKSGKRKKLPLIAGTNRKADTTDPATWSTLEACKDRPKGFVFTAEDPYLFIDLDHVLNPDGTFKDTCGWAKHIVEELDNYTEISPSGDGLHIFCKAAYPEGLKNKTTFKDGTALEIYSQGRYSTVTGNIFQDRIEVKEANTEVLYNYGEPVDAVTSSTATGGKSTLTVDEVITQLKAEGHWQEPKPDADQSAEDMALANHIAFYCNGDYPVFKEVFLRHPYGQRDKVRLRSDYLKRTFDSVMKNKEQFYGSDATLEEVTEMITTLEAFGGAALKPVLIAITRLKSAIDEDTAIEFLKDTAKSKGVKITKSAIKKELDHHRVKVLDKEVPFEELEKELPDMKVLLIGSSLKIMMWQEVPRVKGDEVYTTKAFSFIDPSNLNHYYTGSKKTAFKRWLEHSERPSYEGVVFVPNNQSIIKNSVNLWNGYSCTPVEGDITPFMDVIENVACSGDKEQFDYFKGYIAHQFQRPTEKPEVAIVLKGGKGIGKDTIIDSIGKLYNDAYMPVATKEQVTGRFNGHMANLMMLSVAEQVFAGSHSEDSVMKNLITNPTLTLEKKGVDAVTVDSYLRVYMSSNEDWVVPATGDERRYFVPDTSDIYKQNKQYFEKYWKWYREGGKEALLYWALNYDISEFDVRTYPETQSAIDQKVLTLQPIDIVLVKIINASKDEVVITAKEVADMVNEDNPKMYTKAVATKIGVALKNIFGAVKRLRLSNGSHQKGWRMSKQKAMEIMIKRTGIPDLFDIDDTLFEDLDTVDDLFV